MSKFLDPRERNFVERLLEWGRKNNRDFPWRRTSDPYNVLIAELLLQRTNAGQVEPVYRSFVSKWPNVKLLSKAPLGEIRETIMSLGLIYRANRLKVLSDKLAKEFDGCISPQALRILKGAGVGKYIENAVSCFAFSEDLPVVDRNVLRILSRVFSLKVSQNSHRNDKVWRFAAGFVPKGKSKEYNWSLIDLSAKNCTPTLPKCSDCPILEICDYGSNRNLVS